MKAKNIKMKLNFFNETTVENETPQTPDTTNKGNEKVPEAKDQTKEETEKETEKKVKEETKPIEKHITQKELDQKVKEETAKAVTEALKIAGLDEESKKIYEQEQKEKALNEREQAIATRELKAETINLLAQSELELSFADIVIGTDTERTKENIKNLKATFDKAVQTQVEKRLAGKSPNLGNENTTPETEQQKIEKLMGVK
jgi:phosphoglycolate phosphatase-like HAD superfamily hydrolase